MEVVGGEEWKVKEAMKKLTPLEKAALRFEREFFLDGNDSVFTKAWQRLHSAAVDFGRRYRREAEKGKRR